MNGFLTATGAVVLTFGFIWACLWLEVLRDPKNELEGFYSRNPRLLIWIGLINKAWGLLIITGIFLLAFGR